MSKKKASQPYADLTDVEREHLDAAILWLTVSLDCDSVAYDRGRKFDVVRNALAATIIAARPARKDRIGTRHPYKPRRYRR